MDFKKNEMINIPKGKFLMGSSNDDFDAFDNEKPQKEILITSDFLMSKYVVTKSLYNSVMVGQNYDKIGEDRIPMGNVSWLDSILFCNQLNELTNNNKYYAVESGKVSIIGGNGYRLPFEYEWEYACKANSQTRFFFGNNAKYLKNYAWFKENSNNSIMEVGLKTPNAFGLYDMLGNMWEWCYDNYIHSDIYKDYYIKWPKLTDKAISIYENRTRILKGGAFDMPSRACRPANKDVCGENYRHFANSIRLVKNY